jgi:hypothetical protein
MADNKTVSPQVLTHYLHAWSLSQPQRIAETPTSRVYTVGHEGKTVILKLLTPQGAKDEAAGAVALTHFAGRGAGCCVMMTGRTCWIGYRKIAMCAISPPMSVNSTALSRCVKNKYSGSYCLSLPSMSYVSILNG